MSACGTRGFYLQIQQFCCYEVTLTSNEDHQLIPCVVLTQKSSDSVHRSRLPDCCADVMAFLHTDCPQSMKNLRNIKISFSFKRMISVAPLKAATLNLQEADVLIDVPDGLAKNMQSGFLL